jgi:hypothetical protein
MLPHKSPALDSLDSRTSLFPSIPPSRYAVILGSFPPLVSCRRNWLMYKS